MAPLFAAQKSPVDPWYQRPICAGTSVILRHHHPLMTQKSGDGFDLGSQMDQIFIKFALFFHAFWHLDLLC
jgi:hypothetical protein